MLACSRRKTPACLRIFITQPVSPIVQPTLIKTINMSFDLSIPCLHPRSLLPYHYHYRLKSCKPTRHQRTYHCQSVTVHEQYFVRAGNSHNLIPCRHLPQRLERLLLGKRRRPAPPNLAVYRLDNLIHFRGIVLEQRRVEELAQRPSEDLQSGFGNGRVLVFFFIFFLLVLVIYGEGCRPAG
jgi:hypothetical protein